MPSKPAAFLVGPILFSSPMFAKKDGMPVTRDRTCECGTPFTQALISWEYMESLEKHRPRAAELMLKQIPELYVPVHCPPCERRDITRQAAVDAIGNR